MSRQNHNQNPTAADRTDYEGDGPSQPHDNDQTPDDTVATTPTTQLVAEPKSLSRIDDALDRFFEAFQQQFTDYHDCAPRDAFVKDMQDRGVSFHQPEATGANAFANLENDPGRHGIVTGGQGGGENAVSLDAIDYNAGLIDGGLHQLHGWYLTAEAQRQPVLRFFDTDDVGPRLQQQAPADAGEFVRAELEHFDHTGDGGSGNDAIAGLGNILSDPDRVAWFLEALTLDARSVVETAAVLGGGTGTALTILADEFARMGLIGNGNVSVGFTLGMQLGRVQNDIAIGQFDDGSTRFTFHDAYAAAYRVGQRLTDGDANWALWNTNVALTYNWWALNNQPDFSHLQDFYHPVREGTDPASVARIVDREPRFADTTHTERDRVKCLAEFPFRRLVRRDASVQFSVGDEDYDPADFRTDFHGHAWTTGFDAVHDYDSLADRDIPHQRAITGHRDALYAISHTAAAQLNSMVSHDELQTANAVVHAADMDITANDLQLIEDAVAGVLDLGADANSGHQPVRAISMEGFSAAEFPGEYPLALAVYAGHDLPLLAHEQMATPEYKAAVTGNGGDGQ